MKIKYFLFECLIIEFTLIISILNTESINPSTYLPIIFGSSHVYLNTTALQPITIPCKPRFYAFHQQTVTLYKILSVINNPIEEVLIKDSIEFGSVTYDNNTGYHFLRPQWSVNNTRLICLLTDLHEQTEGLIIGNVSHYIKYFINVTDIDFGISEIKLSAIEPNNQYLIFKNYGDVDSVQLNATIIEPNVNNVDITWYKDDREIIIPDYRMRKIGDKVSLEINNYTLSDSGVFTLTARTMKSFINVSWSLIVDASVETELILSANQVAFREGLNYTLYCNVRLMEIGSMPNITWYSAQCDDPINTDCMGDQFIPKWNVILSSQTGNDSLMSLFNERINRTTGQRYEISSNISVIADNSTYQCIIDQIWCTNSEQSYKQVQQKLMIAIDAPETQLKNSSFIKLPAQLISKINGNRLELMCRVNVGLYANDISFYYSEQQTETMNRILASNTKDNVNISLGYIEKILIKDNPSRGVYTCKYRKRGSNLYDELNYTFNSSSSIKTNIFLMFCVLSAFVIINRYKVVIRY